MGNIDVGQLKFFYLRTHRSYDHLAIVKLFVHYEFQKPGSWAMGTGWLIRPDIFVTAGHCSYDWSHKMGRATEVKAYIGYEGNQSEKSPSVQFRHVKRIVTTEGWVKTKGQKSFDVSFMQVEAPFTGTTPVRFEETPAQGSMVLGVVGYPGDLSDKHTGEKGAHMYECFLPTEFDISTQPDTMLEYEIDTFGGEFCVQLYTSKSRDLMVVDQVIPDPQSSEQMTWLPSELTYTEGHSTPLRSLENMAILMEIISPRSVCLCQTMP